MKKENTGIIKLTSGKEIPKGTLFEIMFDKSEMARLSTLANEKPIRMPVRVLHRYFKGFSKPPSLKTLEKTLFDSGTSQTVNKKKVEPDGYDEYGAPAWPLVMGIV